MTPDMKEDRKKCHGYGLSASEKQGKEMLNIRMDGATILRFTDGAICVKGRIPGDGRIFGITARGAEQKLIMR